MDILWGILQATVGPAVKPIMRRLLPQRDILSKMCISTDHVDPHIYLTQQRSNDLDGMHVRIRNFWAFRLEFESWKPQITLVGRIVGRTDASFNPPQVRRYGGETQATLSAYRLSPQDIQYLRNDCGNPDCVPVSLAGLLRFRTWFGTYCVTAGVSMRAIVHKD